MPKLNKLMTKAPQGFTLVELSIVIIIIGFLIAGIAAGTSLVQQAALNSVIVEAQTYLAAFNTFKSRYSYYPGDFPYASSYWPNTVNGNGDGLIQYPDENQGVWEQLNADKIISLSINYNGDYNEPYAKFGANTIWRAESNGCSVYSMPANTKNSLEILKVDASDFLTALNGSQIDNKIDDGKPSDGKVYGVNSHGSLAIVRADGTTVARGDCINNYNSTEAKYNLPLTDTGITRMYFYLPE